jgi:hypothetical protein
MQRFGGWIISAILLPSSVCALTPFAFAQGGPQPCSTASAEAPQLDVSTKSTRYRIGELIPLELSFSSRIPKRYQINMARYDRSGRMSYEHFVVSPGGGTRDPVAVYFNAMTVFFGGGLTSFDFLSSKPTLIELNLNEWVRFDKTGTYEVKVISNRVSDVQAGDNPLCHPLEVQSNTITLQVVPADAAWQRAQFAQAVAQLGRGTRHEVYTAHDPYWQALSVLRYLGTEAAARELAHRFTGDNNNTDWECMFGLIGLPNRQIGFKEMDELFDDPQFPVSSMFLITMSVLPLDASEPPESLRKQREENSSALRERLATAVNDKQGKALATSLETLFASGGKLSAQARSRLVPQLVQAFPLLSLSEQLTWLEYRWDEIKSPAWIPVLRDTASRYQDFDSLREEHAYESLGVSGASLMRWYELDPDGARDAIIEEITRPKPRYDATVLGILPDKALPEVGGAIVQNLQSADNFEIEGNLASLLFRYADASVLPEVLAKAEPLVGKWACEPQDKTLAYVLKVDPETARPLIERALEARGPNDNGCRHALFTDIGSLQPSPVLEELALKSLDDPDPEVIMNAADYLREHGSAAAEQPLWVRYERWNREWRGRESELRYAEGADNLHIEDANLGDGLARALATGVGWLADEAKLGRIQQLAVGEGMRQQIAQYLRSWEQGLSIQYISSSPLIFSIAQYDLRSIEDLKTKLEELPRGTKLLLPEPEAGASEEELAALQQVLDIASKAGLVITRAPGPSVQ